MKVSTILIDTMSYKLSFPAYAVAALCLSFCGPSRGEEQVQPDVPKISDIHRSFLSRVARRTLRDAVLGRDMYEPGYVPAALGGLTCEVAIRLRQRGYLRAAGTAGPSPVTRATRDAALAAYHILGDVEGPNLALVNELLIEIEVVGSPEPIPLDNDWTRPRAVDPYIEPGVHGIVLLGPDAQHTLLPTEVFTSDRIVADILEEWAKSTQADPSRISKTRLMRFRTAHWYQPAFDDTVVSLHRGLTLVPPGAVSPQGLDAAIDTLAQYMAYRQLASGLFTYQYEPGADRYSEEDNLVRQVGATAAMAEHATFSAKSASLAAADAGINYHLQGLTDISDVTTDLGEAAFIATADKRNKLGVTALLTIAMARHPHHERYASTREKLVNGMLSLQRPSGMFITAFPPAEKVDAQDYFPGEALLAMAMQYEHEPSSRILEAFDRAMTFYRAFFRESPSPAFVPWQVQAYSLMAGHGKRRDYIDYVFELTDWLAAKQLDPANCQWPEMWGGIASYQKGRAGVATAAYLEGFADALALAREVGDVDRAARYETLVKEAARFVMQLQVRPEEAYFIRSPQDAIGGIRTAPALNLLRIDHCQHALVGLIKARRVLFP